MSKKPKLPMAADIDQPNGSATVNPGYPGACNGTVACSGTVVRDPLVWQLCRVVVRVDPATVPMDTDSILSGGYQINTWDPTAGEWNPANNRWGATVGGATCQGGAQCTNGANNCGVVAVWRRVGSMMDLENDTHIEAFTGLCGENITLAEAAGARVAKKAGPKKVKAGTVLKFKNVSPQQNGFGFRLTLKNGDPLRASKIAIVAHKVEWSPNGERISTVRRPTGNHRVAESVYRFRNHFENCIALIQVGNAVNPARLTRTIVAQSPKDPEVLDLHNDQDIFIRVNDLPIPTPHVGSFSLWVKVLAH